MTWITLDYERSKPTERKRSTSPRQEQPKSENLSKLHHMPILCPSTVLSSPSLIGIRRGWTDGGRGGGFVFASCCRDDIDLRIRKNHISLLSIQPQYIRPRHSNKTEARGSSKEAERGDRNRERKKKPQRESLRVQAQSELSRARSPCNQSLPPQSRFSRIW